MGYTSENNKLFWVINHSAQCLIFKYELSGAIFASYITTKIDLRTLILQEHQPGHFLTKYHQSLD